MSFLLRLAAARADCVALKFSLGSVSPHSPAENSTRAFSARASPRLATKTHEKSGLAVRVVEQRPQPLAQRFRNPRQPGGVDLADLDHVTQMNPIFVAV